MSTNFHQVANNAVGTIQSNPLTAGATSVVVNSALDSILSVLVAVGPVFVTMWANSTNPTSDAGMEIGEITARTGANTYTINRGQQITSASQHALNDNIGILFTLGNAEEITPQGTVAQGEVYYIGSDNLPHLLAVGSTVTQQALVTGGAGSNPAWTTINSTLYKDTADLTTSINTSEQTIASFTLSGNTLGTNRIVRFRAYIANGAVQNTPAIVTWRVYFGATAVSLTMPSSGGSSAYNGYVEMLLFGTGATNTQKLLGQAVFNNFNGATIGVNVTGENASVAIDSTTNQTIKITSQVASTTGAGVILKYASIAELIA